VNINTGIGIEELAMILPLYERLALNRLSCGFQILILLSGLFASLAHCQVQSGLIAAKEFYVDHGDYSDVDNPPCRGSEDNVLADIVQGLAHATIVIPSLGQFVGSFIDQSLPAVRELAKQSGGDLLKPLAPNRYANCGTVFLQVLPGTTNLSVKVLAAEGDKHYQECTERAGQFLKCPQPAGWSAWIWKQDGDFIGATYKNWSHDRARNGRIEVYGILWPLKHTVIKGESLSTISLATYGRFIWGKVYRANVKDIDDPDLIYPGQVLLLLSPKTPIR
jgi:hypothetical protein